MATAERGEYEHCYNGIDATYDLSRSSPMWGPELHSPPIFRVLDVGSRVPEGQ
jgi:hypothetical protein